MDSFYELSLQEDTNQFSSNNLLLKPMVPDVSILQEDSRTVLTQGNRRPGEHLSYNAWRHSQATQLPTSKFKVTPMSQVVGTENSYTPLQVSNSILRKQVRFQSPTLRLQDKYSPTEQNNIFDRNDFIGPTFNNIRSGNHSKISDFEHIYSTNVPNRKLDLSIIEPSLPKENSCSKFAQMEKKLETPVYDILNYKSPLSKNIEDSVQSSNPIVDYVSAQTYHKRMLIDKDGHGLEEYLLNKTNNSFDNSPKIMKTSPNLVNSPSRDNLTNHITPTKVKDTQFYDKHCFGTQTFQIPEEPILCRSSSTTSNTALVPSTNSESPDHPSVRDLLKIIQQQNEQLLILQKQVATLIDGQQTQQRVIQNQHTQRPMNEPTTFQVFDKDKFCQKKSVIPNKFNIDVMTSFEVSIRPQQRPSGHLFDGGYRDAKIQEITEDFDNNMHVKNNFKQVDQFNGSCKTNELSLMLSEPLQIQEGRMSPEKSVHVNMLDYSSDDSDTNDPTDLGWTIYNNVMCQVNNILTKANVGKLDKMNAHTCKDKIRSKTMKKVKEATLRHLQSIGVNISIEDRFDSLRTQNSADGLDYSPTEVSFAVQQLLMKYLPSEHLAKLSNVPQDAQKEKYLPNVRKPIKCGPKENLVLRRPEFSFATVQYMKKYNLMESLADNKPKIPLAQKIHPTPHNFLDITALKRQPKLL